MGLERISLKAHVEEMTVWDTVTYLTGMGDWIKWVE